jgi:hypothetical protein
MDWLCFTSHYFLPLFSPLKSAFLITQFIFLVVVVFFDSFSFSLLHTIKLITSTRRALSLHKMFLNLQKWFLFYFNDDFQPWLDWDEEVEDDRYRTQAGRPFLRVVSCKTFPQNKNSLTEIPLAKFRTWHSINLTNTNLQHYHHSEIQHTKKYKFIFLFTC